jgi:hypothetical protein
VGSVHKHSETPCFGVGPYSQWISIDKEVRIDIESIYALILKCVSCPVTGLKWPRGWVEVKLYSFLTSALEGGGWSAPRSGRFTPGKDSVPIVQEARWASGPVWTCAKNLAPTGIRSPDRPARSQSLYRLSYPARKMCKCHILIRYSMLATSWSTELPNGYFQGIFFWQLMIWHWWQSPLFCNNSF